MKTVDLYNPFQKKRRMLSSAIAQQHQHVSSEDEGKQSSPPTMYRLTSSGMPVFDILEPGCEERTYKNPLMDCSSMGECKFISCRLMAKTIDMGFEDLDALSAHDRWKDGKSLQTVHLQTPVDCRSLDLGFPVSDDDRMTCNQRQPQSDILNMQFPTMSDDDLSNGEILDLGFPPQPDDGDELDLGFDIDAGNTGMWRIFI